MSEPGQLILTLAFVTTLVGAGGAILLHRAGSGRDEHPPAAPRGRVNVWFYRPGDMVGALVVYLVFAALFLLTCLSPPVEASDFDAEALVTGIGFQLVLATAVTLAALRHSTIHQWLGVRWSGWPWLLLIGPGSVILMSGVFWLIQVSGYVEWMESLGVETLQETVQLLRECQDPVVLTLLVITATVVAPVCEEIVFRGYLHPVLKKFGGIWAGALFSSLLFGIAHGNLTVMLPLFLLGLLLVWLYERTGSIWTPIAVHFCFNATTVVAQLATRHLEIPATLVWP